MKVILFGATGMVGQGALRECLAAADVERVLVVVRSSTGQRHDKLREVVQPDITDLSALAPELSGYDVCLFCLGVSVAGLSEAEYRRLTYELTLRVASLLARVSPGMTFIYVSGASTDGTERGRVMWARVKGKTENELLRLPFRAAYMFRPGAIQPLHGIQSKTKAYRIFYSLFGPLLPLLRAWFPNHVVTTEVVGRAMLEAVRQGGASRVVEMPEINVLGSA